VIEGFDLLRDIYRVPPDRYAKTRDELVSLLRLERLLHQPVRQLSLGQRMRCDLAAALLHAPSILFLDEPTIGLDPQTRRSIWGYIRELKEREEITIFMTTHYMDEAEWCDRIAIMDHGQIVALDAPETLKAGVGHDRVTIHTDDDQAAIEALQRQFGIEAKVAEGTVTFGVSAGEEFVPRLFAEWDPSHPPIRSVSVSRPTLDDVFMSYTGTTIRDAEEDQSKHRNRVMMQMMGGGRR
jgi:ABC-2 type transport system ATP-binding protein